MSALILKDYYVIFRQMRIFLLLVLVFSCIPGAFYSTFAVVYASMLPYTALAYDERSHWDQMAAMMPYSDRDLVLSKYVFGWLSTAAAAAATFVLQTVLAAVWSGAEGPSVPVILLSVCVAVCILDITLPMMFRFGVEKGRLAFTTDGFIVSPAEFPGERHRHELNAREREQSVRNRGEVFPEREMHGESHGVECHFL